MTWGEFKKAVEAIGVSDGTELDLVDWKSGPLSAYGQPVKIEGEETASEWDRDQRLMDC